jgi:hypothetical protein
MGVLSGGPADQARLDGLRRRTEYVAVLNDGPWLCPENPGGQDVPRLMEARGRWYVYERATYATPDSDSVWLCKKGPLT